MQEQTNRRGKKRKRKGLIILCIAVTLMLADCGRDTQKEVRTVFDSQEEVIRERIADTGTKDKDKWKDLEGVIKVEKEDEGALRFMCIAEGIVSASFEAGFYYSPDDKPTCVGWLYGPLAEDGEGYSYHEEGTDNYYYTEKMSENFYYYSVKN